MSHARQIEEAEDALQKLEASLMDFDPESGELLALAVEEVAATLCAIETLELPNDMRDEAPSLDEVLAYLTSIGRLDDEEAIKIAASIIEYLQAGEYGEYPETDDYPAFEEYETMTEALRALLSSLEHET